VAAAARGSATADLPAHRQGEGRVQRAFIPLQFEAGEAFQFDWSEGAMVVVGLYRKIQVAHLKLCFSRAFWLTAYPSQGHEMLMAKVLPAQPKRHQARADASHVMRKWRSNCVRQVRRRVCRGCGRTARDAAGMDDVRPEKEAKSV
jgi:hypothetical protein